MIDNQWVVEVGGRKKDFTQMSQVQEGIIACDDIEQGAGRKIPLWLFGFLY